MDRSVLSNTVHHVHLRTKGNKGNTVVAIHLYIRGDIFDGFTIAAKQSALIMKLSDPICVIKGFKIKRFHSKNFGLKQLCTTEKDWVLLMH